MDTKAAHTADEKQFSSDDEKAMGPPAYSGAAAQVEVAPGGQRELSRALKGRHMQMIAIGMDAHMNLPSYRSLAHGNVSPQEDQLGRASSLARGARCIPEDLAVWYVVSIQASLASSPFHDKPSGRVASIG